MDVDSEVAGEPPPENDIFRRGATVLMQARRQRSIGDDRTTPLVMRAEPGSGYNSKNRCRQDWY